MAGIRCSNNHDIFITYQNVINWSEKYQSTKQAYVAICPQCGASVATPIIMNVSGVPALNTKLIEYE